MNTKLEALIEVLQTLDTDKEVLDTLILDYYNTQNITEFEGEHTYRVFTQRELDDELYNFAELKVEEDIESLVELVDRRNAELFYLTNNINSETAVDYKLGQIDVEDFAANNDLEFILEHNGYFIFEVIL
jgi:hypothetical protein